MTLPKDQPDNYPWFPGSERTPLIDVGELAARIGSPVTYDRRGEVLWYGMFQCGYTGWTIIPAPAIDSVFVVAEDTLRGGFTVQLKGRGAGNTVYLRKGFAPLYQENLGFEVGVCFLDPFNYFQLRILRYDGTNLHVAGLRFDDSVDELQYYSHLDTWVKCLDASPPHHTTAIYHHVKIVADMENDEYLRFLWDNEEVDLDDIAFYSTASAPGPYVIFEIGYNADDSNDQCNLAHAIITGNEPKKE
jgi:hypothetical protein